MMISATMSPALRRRRVATDMAQVPATPKWQRLRNRLSLALGQTPQGLQASETAALALARARLRAQPAMRSRVTFLIPLVGPAQVGDWNAVTERLRQTLASFIAQDNPNWRAVICCQDHPPLPRDPRVMHLPFKDDQPGNDKWRKLAALGDWLRDNGGPSGYAMSFDADDLLRQGSVREMLERQSDGGYLVRSGYVMDHATGRIGLADRQTLLAPGRKAFWKLCGSCTALPFDPQMPQSAAFFKAMTAHEHRMFPYLSRLAGLRLQPLSRPSVLYVLNHGENFGARRGRVGFKTRYVERFRLSDAKAQALFQGAFPKT